MPGYAAPPGLRSGGRGKVVSAAEAVQLIRDGDTVATGGFVGIGFAEEIAIALERLYTGADGPHPAGSDKPHEPDARLCGRPGRRQGTRAQPFRPSRAW